VFTDSLFRRHDTWETSSTEKINPFAVVIVTFLSH